MLGRPPEGSEGEATSYGAVAMLQPGHTASGPGTEPGGPAAAPLPPQQGTVMAGLHVLAP